jgi:hypothetical protein
MHAAVAVRTHERKFIVLNDTGCELKIQKQERMKLVVSFIPDH